MAAKRDAILMLQELNENIRSCRKCRLWQGAKCAVPGEGPDNARVMLVGQNPGVEEDKVGRPFIGRAGKFLDKVLVANRIDRTQIFVTNIVKHLTPENRIPRPDEVEACLPYLITQIDAIQPKVIVLMGKMASQTPKKQGVLFVETVHPSAAMRFTKMRERFKRDFADLASLY